MTDPTIRLLHELIAIDSVNPALSPGGAGEEAIASRIAGEMRSFGMAVQVRDAAPGRPNVVGVLERGSRGRSLMLCGHTDTVGVAGMHYPFVPIERDGRIHGRGAQDMKGGLAAMLGAARAIAESGGPAAGRLIVAAVADEEHGSLGADALVRDWRADAAVVAEPTDLALAVAHKGFTWVEVTARGRAAHGSRPDEGRDAILRMGRFLARLEELERDLRKRPPHPSLGTGSLHASVIAGGRELSTYPDLCTLTLERRTLMGEPPGVALEEVEAILDGLRSADPELEAEAREVFTRPAYELAPDHPFLAAMESSLSVRGLSPARAAMTFWTDAAILGEAGIPSVIFGPGGAGLHGLDEYVHKDEVLACRDVFVDLVRTWCA
ncbi:MAG: ArgE/DapE family deacylase [Thermoanaerobaculia bacterium]